MVKSTKSNLKEKCPRCVKGTLVTDHESGEMCCSKCGFVLSENYRNQDQNGDPLLKTNMVIELELELLHHLQCMTWDLQQSLILLTKMHLESL